MGRCLLTVRGLAWMVGLGLVGWLSLFAAAAVINRWIHEQEPNNG